VPNCLQIISSALLFPLMGSNGSIPGGPCQILSISERDVLALLIPVTFGQPEIYNVQIILINLCPADQKVIWLDISMKNALLMYLLYSFNHCNGA